MRYIKIPSLMTLFFVMTNSYSQIISIEKIKKEETVKSNGIFYALPKTHLGVEVEITRITNKAPEDPTLCSQLFRNCEAVFDRKPYNTEVLFEISRVSTFAKTYPDEKNIFKVDARKKWNQDRTLGLTLSDKGIIQGGQASRTDKTFEIISSVIGTAIEIALLRMNSEIDTIENRRLKYRNDIKAIVNKKLGRSPEDERSKIFLDKQITECDKRIDKIGQLKKRLEKYLQAKEELIVSSSAGMTEDAIKYKVSEIQKLIDKELVILLGSQKKETFTYRFEIPIDQMNDKGLLKITTKGIYLIDATDITINNTSDFNTTNNGLGKTLKLSIQKDPKGFSELVGNVESIEKTNCLAYRLPASGIITLKLEEEIKSISVLPVAQFGSVVHLPVKMNKMNIKFHEEQGSLMELSMESNSIISGDQITKGGELIGKAKKLNDEKTELDKLKEENELLEAKKKNKDLKKSLDGGQ